MAAKDFGNNMSNKGRYRAWTMKINNGQAYASLQHFSVVDVALAVVTPKCRFSVSFPIPAQHCKQDQALVGFAFQSNITITVHVDFLW
jgi:hypothetical protein